MGRHRKKNRESGTMNAEIFVRKNPEMEEITGDRQLTYDLAHSPVFGRYLVSKTDLKQGDLILEEKPLVIGPCQDSGPLCLGCYVPIESIENSFRCERCRWPMCGPSCKGNGHMYGHEDNECSALSCTDTAPKEAVDSCFYDAIVPLRCLLLKETDPWKWDRLNEMQSHDVIRKTIPSIWLKNQKFVVDRILKDWNLQNYTEDIVHSICGYLEVNCFSVGDVEGRLRGLYPTAFLCAHDCTPNTSHIDSNDFTMRIWTTVSIPSGSPLTLSYTSTLLGTARRRAHLLESKFFECCCRRCADPTELGTDMSTLRCQKCLGWMRKTEPLKPQTPFVCDRCGNQVHAATADQLADRSLAEAQRLSSVDDLEKFVMEKSTSLHPNHFAIISAKLTLSQLYGKVEGVRIDQMGISQLERKLHLCREILPVLDVVEPGFSRIRAVTLYEAHAPLMMLTNFSVQCGGLNQTEIIKRLRQVVLYLKESCAILKCENADSAEGQTYLAAQEALANTKAWEPLIGKM